MRVMLAGIICMDLKQIQQNKKNPYQLPAQQLPLCSVSYGFHLGTCRQELLLKSTEYSMSSPQSAATRRVVTSTMTGIFGKNAVPFYYVICYLQLACFLGNNATGFSAFFGRHMSFTLHATNVR